jgi:hypothetical protein
MTQEKRGQSTDRRGLNRAVRRTRLLPPDVRKGYDIPQRALIVWGYAPA